MDLGINAYLSNEKVTHFFYIYFKLPNPLLLLPLTLYAASKLPLFILSEILLN
jgi:hypothetical protein